MMPLKDGLLSQIGEKRIITLFKYLTGTMFILIREDRLRRSPLQAQVIQVTGSRLEAIAYFPQRGAISKLTKDHGDQVTPGVETFAEFITAILGNDGIDDFARNFADDLSKQCYIGHRKLFLFSNTTRVTVLP